MKERENLDLRAVVDLVTSNHDNTLKELDIIRKQQDERHRELLEFVRSGFPQGDIHAHKAFHEAEAQRAKERADLRHELMKKIITGSAWGAILFIGSYAVTAAQQFLREHFK